MTSVNVNRNLTDQFYRYKMPKLIAKVEGKGNGIKTVIVNMVEVAKALNRPPMYPTKYFGCILGAQVNCDLKNERYIVNGSHESNKLQDILDGFIQKYVLCASCGNPETVLSVSQKKGIIATQCKACGYAGTISTTDKLSTYILKYPPSAVSGNAANASLTQGKKSKRRAKEEKNGKKDENGDKNGHNESDEGNGNEDDDGDWCEDTSEDAVAKRMEELSAGAKGLMLNDDMEKSPKERARIFYDFVKKKKDSVNENASFDVAMQKDIVGEAERLDIRDRAVLTLCELLFDEKMLQQIKTHRMLLLRFTAENEKAQKYLLRGFELIIQLYKNQLIAKVAHILKSFYDLDILDEKLIIDWGTKKSKKNVGKELADEIHEKATPFIKWLKEAEEEDSNEDDEEEEIEVVYDDRMRGTEIRQEEIKPQSPLKTTNIDNNNINTANMAKKVESAVDDEIDIDAI